MMHETDIQRVTLQLRQCTHQGIVRWEKRHNWGMTITSILIGVVIGLMFSLAMLHR